MNKLPQLQDIIAHDAPMLLIDELVEAGKEHVHCRVVIDESGLFFDTQKQAVPAYVGMEFMAQAVAAWAGFHARERGEKPPIGFLLGGRKYTCEVPAFEKGLSLDIFAKQLMKNENMAAFSCAIKHDGRVLAECDLNVYEPPPEEQIGLNG